LTKVWKQIGANRPIYSWRSAAGILIGDESIQGFICGCLDPACSVGTSARLTHHAISEDGRIRAAHWRRRSVVSEAARKPSGSEQTVSARKPAPADEAERSFVGAAAPGAGGPRAPNDYYAEVVALGAVGDDERTRGIRLPERLLPPARLAGAQSGRVP
jgi:hypothetical protein